MLAVIARAVFVQIGKRHFLAARAVQDDVLDVWRQLFERNVQIEVVVAGEASQQLIIELVAPVPPLDRTGSQRKVRKGNDPFGIEKRDSPETVAPGAGTHRIVEGKQARLQFRQRITADRTTEFC